MTKVCHSKEEIAAKVLEVAQSINALPDKENISIICVLTGGLFFFSDVVKHLNFNVMLDFVDYSSYQNNTQMSEGCFKLDLSHSITNRDVILLEDIVDSGKTAIALLSEFNKRNPKSLKMISLLGKPKAAAQNSQIEIVWEHDDGWVMGYGMDSNEFERNIDHLVIKLDTTH